MIVGNALASTVVVCRRLLAEVADKRLEIEARLALGQAGPDALRPYTRSALRTALLPAIERTKVVGLVALPGAMTGLILAGVPPADAVKVQAAVMFELLGAEAAAVSVVSLGLAKRLLTSDHRLVRLVRAEDLKRSVDRRAGERRLPSGEEPPGRGGEERDADRGDEQVDHRHLAERAGGPRGSWRRARGTRRPCR